MIEIRQLTKSLHGGGHRVDILTGIDLTIPDGQFVAVTGPSGSGKTTLLSLIAGLDAPTGGSILIDGEDITKLSEDELALLRGRRFGFSLEEIRQWLDLYNGHGDNRVQMERMVEMSTAQIDELESRKAQLQEAIDELSGLRQLTLDQLHK